MAPKRFYYPLKLGILRNKRFSKKLIMEISLFMGVFYFLVPNFVVYAFYFVICFLFSERAYSRCESGMRKAREGKP